MTLCPHCGCDETLVAGRGETHWYACAGCGEPWPEARGESMAPTPETLHAELEGLDREAGLDEQTCRYLRRVSARNARRAEIRAQLAALEAPASEEPGEVSAESFLSNENRALREAGCALAESATRVVRESDGTHRLMLAVANWAKAVADEGGRGARYGEPPSPSPSAVAELVEAARELETAALRLAPAEISKARDRLEAAIRGVEGR